MNHIVKKSETALSGGPEINLQSRFSRSVFAFLGILAILFATAGANAACGNWGQKPGDPMKFPAQVQGENTWGVSIVGLWHVTETMGDTTTLFGASLKQWHSDGTEFENVDHSAVIGNICFGVWKQVGARTVHLHHTGWIFDDNGNPAGSFMQDETDMVASNGMSYSGTFTFKVYDPNGDYVSGSEVTGKIVATRFTVN